MAKAIIFYEDGMIREWEDKFMPSAINYPTYTIMYAPATMHKWFRCMQYTFPNSCSWDRIDPEVVNKKFRTYALIAG